jgi:hypothetical protein
LKIVRSRIFYDRLIGPVDPALLAAVFLTGFIGIALTFEWTEHFYYAAKFDNGHAADHIKDDLHPVLVGHSFLMRCSKNKLALVEGFSDNLVTDPSELPA